MNLHYLCFSIHAVFTFSFDAIHLSGIIIHNAVPVASDVR